MSAVASALAILALFDVVRRVYGTRAALWSALIMALAGPQVELAQEVRPYAMLTLMSLLCADVILIIQDECANTSDNKALRSRFSSFLLQPSSLCISLALVIFLTMLMHYFAVGVMLGLGAYTIIVMRGRARWMVLSSFVIAAMIFCVTWLPKMISQRETVAKTADTWLKEPPGGHLIRTATRLADVPLRLLILHEIATDKYSRNLKYGSIGIVIVPFFLLRRGRGRSDLALLCCWLGGTLGLLVTLDISRSTRHLELVRYCLIAGPAIYALPAALALRANAWIRNGIPALVAFSCLCALPALVDLSKQKYREAGVYLDKHVEPGDVVVIFNYDNEPFYAAFTWLSLAHYSKTYPWPFVLVNGPFDNHIREQLKDVHAIWVVAPPGRVAPGKIVPGADPKYLDYFHRFAEIYRLPAPGREKE